MKTKSTPINSKTYNSYRSIKNLIFSGELYPGQKITYRELEDKLKMSKTPIINALMMLERDNLVLSKRNRGFYIRIVKKNETQHRYELRQALEDIAITNAVKNHDENDLKKFKKKLDDYEQYQSDIYDQKRWALDCAFHLHIVVMGKNPLFIKMMEQFYENIFFMLQVIHLNPSIECFKKDHQLLFETIKNHQLEEAKKIARDHSSMTMGLFMKSLRA